MKRETAIATAKHNAKRQYAARGYVIYRGRNGQWMGCSRNYYDSNDFYARDVECHFNGRMEKLPDRTGN